MRTLIQANWHSVNGFSVTVVRDPDGYIYLRERDGCILAGGFEPIAKPVYEEESEFDK